MSDKRIVNYDHKSKEWVLIDLDGSESRFLSMTDLRDWLDFQENQRG